MDKKLQNFLKNMKKQGKFGFPALTPAQNIPLNLLGFNKMLSADDEWLRVSHVHFFLEDEQFERLWNAPARYLAQLKKARGVIGTDFSCYIDGPAALNIWNIYRNRVLDAFLQASGIDVIPTLVWGSPTTWEFAFEGVPKKSIVAIGTLGCLNKNSRAYFEAGFEEMIRRLDPNTIIVYGELPGKINTKYADRICNYKTFCREKWKRRN